MDNPFASEKDLSFLDPTFLKSEPTQTNQQSNIDRDSWMYQVQEEANNLENVPDNIKDYEMCYAAVSRKGGTLKFVPDRFKDEKMCMKALSTNGYAIQWFPSSLITKEVCVKAAGKDAGSIKFIPQQFVDADTWFAAVMRAPAMIKQVPNHIMTEEFKQRLMQAGFAQKTQPNNIGSSGNQQSNLSVSNEEIRKIWKEINDIENNIVALANAIKAIQNSLVGKI